MVVGKFVAGCPKLKGRRPKLCFAVGNSTVAVWSCGGVWQGQGGVGGGMDGCGFLWVCLCGWMEFGGWDEVMWCDMC